MCDRRSLLHQGRGDPERRAPYLTMSPNKSPGLDSGLNHHDERICTHIIGLLCAVFKRSPCWSFSHTEPLIGEVYLEKILEKLHATLSETKAQADQGGMEPLICFICDVASTFYSSVTDCLLLASAEELLLTAFQITAQDHSNTHLSGEHTDTHTLPISALLQNAHAHTHTRTGGWSY